MTDDLPRITVPFGETSSPAFLVLDTESVPDGDLIARVKYPNEGLTPREAIARAQAEVVEKNGSDFLPVGFQVPVAVCVIRVGRDLLMQKVTCLDAPHYRTKEMVEQFWSGLGRLKPFPKLVTYNGRGFDFPLLELAAFRYGLPAMTYYQSARNRFSGSLDLMDWFGNFGAARGLGGGLDLLAKLIGKPGKMGVSGDQVYALHQKGRYREINDYCVCDTLDTYFVFLRSRVLTGDISPEQEADTVAHARRFLRERVDEFPVLVEYLAAWRDGGLVEESPRRAGGPLMPPGRVTSMIP